MSEKVKYDLDSLLRVTGNGLAQKATSASLNGLRCESRRLITKGPDSNHGLVFMTRPQINLSTANIAGVNELYPLLNETWQSIGAWVRGTLDPRWAIHGDREDRENRYNESLFYDDNYKYDPKLRHTLADPYSAFINIVTNNVIGISGFPDVQYPSFASQPGRLGQTFQIIDGVNNLNQPIELTITLRDMVGDPIYHLFRILSLYSSKCYEGTLSRYPDFILEDCIDYNVRLFRIRLSGADRKVSSIASTYPGFVQGVASGSKYDYNLQEPYTEARDISYRFNFSGAVYEDPLLIADFNGLVVDANPFMRDNKISRYMRKLTTSELSLFSYEKLYPYIDINTLSFDWYIQRTKYEDVMSSVETYRSKLG